jgi:plastocyanin
VRSIAGAAVLVVVAVGSSCGGGSSAEEPPVEARVVEVRATEYAFNGDPGTIVAGDTIEFTLSNVGQLDHSMEVLSPDGRSLGTTDRLAPGSTDQVTVTFDEAGVYRLVCDVDDHMSRGQVATLAVEED